MRTVLLVLPVCLSLGMSSVASEKTEHPEWKSYFETSGVDDTYFFALNLDITKNEDAPKRMIVARQCLASLGILPAVN